MEVLEGATVLTSLNGFDRLAEARAGTLRELEATGDAALALVPLLGRSASSLTALDLRCAPA
jgi:hypothetical protein